MNQEDTDMFSTWFRKAHLSTPAALEELPPQPTDHQEAARRGAGPGRMSKKEAHLPESRGGLVVTQRAADLPQGGGALLPSLGEDPKTLNKLPPTALRRHPPRLCLPTSVLGGGFTCDRGAVAIILLV